MRVVLCRKKLLFASVLTMLVVLATTQLQAAPPLPGAIFTTLADGTRVNQNIYQAKCDVYLDGGPGPTAPATAAGLPDGDYFFQVTDPSGKTLLSTDAVENRQFAVSGGVISGLSGLGNHVTGVDSDHCAVTVQLCPFLDTPNRGGVYKVWVTPVGDFVGDPTQVDSPCGRGCFHGFIPAASKTDNFKVKQGDLPCLAVFKFIDNNRNGQFDEPEDFLAAWPFIIFGPLGDQINGQLFTLTEPGCVVFNLAPGLYRVVEAPTFDPALDIFFVTANILDGRVLSNPELEVLVRIRRRDTQRTLIFGNGELLAGER